MLSSYLATNNTYIAMYVPQYSAIAMFKENMKLLHYIPADAD